MKPLSTTCLALLVGAIALVAARAEDDKKKEATFDAAKMVGDWEFVSGVRAGEKVEKDRLKAKVTISKDKFVLPAGDSKFVMKYKLDTKASPVKLDMEIEDGPVKEGKAVGIIDLKDGELKICYVSISGADEKRPEKFESTEKNKAFYFVLKKAK